MNPQLLSEDLMWKEVTDFFKMELKDDIENEQEQNQYIMIKLSNSQDLISGCRSILGDYGRKEKQINIIVERFMTTMYYKQNQKSCVQNNQIKKVQGMGDDKVQYQKNNLILNFMNCDYQRCAEDLKNMKIVLEQEQKTIKDTISTEGFQQFRAILYFQIQKLWNRQEQILKNLDKKGCEIINQTQYKLTKIQQCKSLMQILHLESLFKEKAQYLRENITEKANQQFLEVNKILDQNNSEEIQKQIEKKLETLSLYQLLNFVSTEVSIKLKMVNEKIKNCLDVQTSILCQFYLIIENKTYSKSNMKLCELLLKLEKTVKKIKNYVAFIKNQGQILYYTDLCKKSEDYLKRYFAHLEIFIKDMNNNIQINKERQIINFTDLRELIQQIKVLSKISNLYDTILLTSLTFNLQDFFHQVIQSSRKVLQEFKIAEKKSANSKSLLKKIQNYFNLLIIFIDSNLEMTFQKDPLLLKIQYDINLKELRISIIQNIQSHRKNINNQKLDYQIISLSRKLKRYFEYVEILRSRCTTICENCFTDIQTLYKDMVSILKRRLEQFIKLWNMHKNNNIQLSKIMNLCAINKCLDKHLDEGYQFERLQCQIIKSFENNLSENILEINQYIIGADYNNLKNIFYKLQKDKSINGKKIFLQGQSFLTNKINQLFDSLPKIQIRIQQKKDYLLHPQEIQQIEIMFNIKYHLSNFIRASRQYQMIQAKTESISILLRKSINSDINTIREGLTNFKLEEIIPNYQNLKRIKKIMILISGNHEFNQVNQIIYEEKSIFDDIINLTQQMEKKYIKNSVEEKRKNQFSYCVTSPDSKNRVNELFNIHTPSLQINNNSSKLGNNQMNKNISPRVENIRFKNSQLNTLITQGFVVVQPFNNISPRLPNNPIFQTQYINVPPRRPKQTKKKSYKHYVIQNIKKGHINLIKRGIPENSLIKESYLSNNPNQKQSLNKKYENYVIRIHKEMEEIFLSNYNNYQDQNDPSKSLKFIDPSLTIKLLSRQQFILSQIILNKNPQFRHHFKYDKGSQSIKFEQYKYACMAYCHLIQRNLRPFFS